MPAPYTPPSDTAVSASWSGASAYTAPADTAVSATWYESVVGAIIAWFTA